MRRILAKVRAAGVAWFWANGLAAALVAIPGVVVAQPLATEPLWDAAEPLESAEASLDHPLALGSEIAHADAYYSGGVEPGPANRPVNWISGPYLKAGPTAILGEGILDDPDIGYTIAGGFRQPLGPEIGGDRVFLDFGGSYLSAYGETTRTRSGTGVTVVNGVVTGIRTVDDAFSNTLKEVKRGGVHAAIGWFWGSPIDDPTWDPQIRVASRFGGRVSHVRGRFAGDDLIVTPNANESFSATADIGHTQTVGGLFFGTEAILLQRQYDFGSVQWTLDAELSNDWIEFEGFEKGSLGAASVMFGFVLSR